MSRTKWELHFKRNGAQQNESSISNVMMPMKMEAPFYCCNGSSITKKNQALIQLLKALGSIKTISHIRVVSSDVILRVEHHECRRR
jgi:hypothetical protein